MYKIIFSNYIINVAVVAWFAAQLLKTVINFSETKIFNPERLVGAGGMPSSHSALVCSLALATARKVGYSSPEFAVTLALAGIVMYDAMGVRRAAGEQAKVLNQMIKGFQDHAESFWNDVGFNKEIEEDGIIFENDDSPSTSSEDSEQKKLKEYIGHTPMEVLGGALLGILIAMIMPVI